MNLNATDVRRLKGLTKKITTEKTRIAKSRDVLRELIGEVEEIIGDADNMVDTLERAVDDLSKYV